MIYVVIALFPGGGGILDSTHETLDAAEKHAEHLNRLSIPYRYVVAEVAA